MEARDASAAVLEGTALDNTLTAPLVKDANGLEWFQVRVVVGKVWKGEVSDTIAILTGPAGGGACGFSFAVGGHYLLFLHRKGTGALSASLCSLSQDWEGAANIVAKLGTPVRKGAT